MLDVYADGEILRSVFKAWDKDNLLPLNQEILKFLQRSCNLCVNEVVVKDRTKPPYYLNMFTQNRGDYAKFNYASFEIELLAETKPWSVFLLSKDNELGASVGQKYFLANQENLIEQLEKLLFERSDQRKSYTVIKNPDKTKNPDDPDNLFFQGWKTLEGNNILELSDVVIIDRYFLEPFKYKKEKPYMEDSIIPLLRILSRQCISEQLNVTVFAEYDKQIAPDAPKDFLDFIHGHPGFCELNISLGLAVAAKLFVHERYFLTNYQGMNPGLSLNGLAYSKVLGNRERFRIYPYSLNPDIHDEDIMFLDELANQIKRGVFEKYGESFNNRLINFKLVSK
jgi:hypothetical protein